MVVNHRERRPGVLGVLQLVGEGGRAPFNERAFAREIRCQRTVGLPHEHQRNAGGGLVQPQPLAGSLIGVQALFRHPAGQGRSAGQGADTCQPHQKTEIRNGLRHRGRDGDARDWRTIRPDLRQPHRQPGVGNAVAEVVAYRQPGAVGCQVGVSQIEMPRREQEDLLHVADGEVGVGSQQQRGQAGDLWCGEGSSLWTDGVERVIRRVIQISDSAVVAEGGACAVRGRRCVQPGVAHRRRHEHGRSRSAVAGHPAGDADARNRDGPRVGRVKLVVGVGP